MSRHGSGWPLEVGVAAPLLRSRHGVDVATWLSCSGGRDLAWGRLLGRVETSARPACAQPALAARATCTRQAYYARSSAHDMGTMHATWVLGVRTVHPTQFCDSALFRVTVWTMFMDTVQEHCSQSTKFLKIFLRVI